MRFWKPNQYAIFLDPIYNYKDKLPPGPLLIIADTETKRCKEKFIDNKLHTEIADIIVVRPENDLILYTAKASDHWGCTLNVYCRFLDLVTFKMKEEEVQGGYFTASFNQEFITLNSSSGIDIYRLRGEPSKYFYLFMLDQTGLTKVYSNGMLQEIIEMLCTEFFDKEVVECNWAEEKIEEDIGWGKEEKIGEDIGQGEEEEEQEDIGWGEEEEVQEDIGWGQEEEEDIDGW